MEWQEPVINLGVTRLSKSGKTVFISDLTHNLLYGGNLELFNAYNNKRIQEVAINNISSSIKQFPHNKYINDIVSPSRKWPTPTKDLSAVSLAINYVSSRTFWNKKKLRRIKLNIIDYPEEWLLDTPLLNISYKEWSQQMLNLAMKFPYSQHSGKFLTLLNELSNQDTINTENINKLSKVYRTYMVMCFTKLISQYALYPGRLLFPAIVDEAEYMKLCPLIIYTKK